MLFIPNKIYKKCFNNSSVVVFVVFMFNLNYSRVSTFSFGRNKKVLHYPTSDQIWVPPLTAVKQSMQIKERNERMISQRNRNFGVQFRSRIERSPRSFIHSSFSNRNRAINAYMKNNEVLTDRSLNEVHILPSDTAHYG